MNALFSHCLFSIFRESAVLAFYDPNLIVSGKNVTSPVVMSCDPPAIRISPFSIISFNIGLRCIIDETVRLILITDTFSTKAALHELRFSYVWVSSSASGLILVSSDVRLPHFNMGAGNFYSAAFFMTLYCNYF